MNTLTLIHEYLERNVFPGAVCVDATAGKGRDTALLCRLCGPAGSVTAFDIQADALDQTGKLLKSENLKARLILDSHSNMEKYLAPDSADFIVFNLGRLPGGDVTIFTRSETTIPALEASLRIVKPGGMILVALYYGGPNGYSEKEAVLDFVSRLDSNTYTVFVGSWLNRSNDPPIPIFIQRMA